MLKVVRGDTVRLMFRVRRLSGWWIFRSEQALVAHPATVVIRITEGDGNTQTDKTLAGGEVQVDTSEEQYGNYYYDLPTASVTDAKLGTWTVAGITTGTPTVADKTTIAIVSEKDST